MQALLDYLSVHAAVAYAAVFLGAFLEAVAVIGTVIPGGTLVFLGGLLAGAGVLDLRSCAGLAILGATLGDGLSYELGRRYHEGIYALWPIRHFKPLVNRGAAFVRRYGAASIFLGRFASPVRAVVPVIAGMSSMPAARFYCWNFISAVAWSAAHLLPGVLIGASLQIAGAVSSRLMVLVLVLVGLGWAGYELARAVFGDAHARWVRLRDALVRWARRHSGPAARLLRSLFDPREPESSALLVSALVLLAGAWIFFGILEDVVTQDALVQFDQSVYALLQAHRSPRLDRFLVAMTELGDTMVVLSVVVAVLGWLLYRRFRRSAAYWLAAAAFAQCAVTALKFTLARPRPRPVHALESFSFPSGHATMNLVVYGFLAFLLARRQPRAVQIAITLAAGAFIGLIAFSRIYLGVHWFSDVVGGLSLGLAWITLLSIAYRHHVRGEVIRSLPLAVVAVATLSVAGALEIGRLWQTDLPRYAYHPQTAVMSADEWLDHGWQRLPAQRLDLGGDPEEPFAVQWAGTEDEVKAALQAAGWEPAAPLAGSLLFLLPTAEVGQLPVVPKLHAGQAQGMAYQRVVAPDERLVLRLWPAPYQVKDTAAGAAAGQAKPLWVGTLMRERAVPRRPFFTTLRSGVEERWPDELLRAATVRAAIRESGQRRVLLLYGR